MFVELIYVSRLRSADLRLKVRSRMEVYTCILSYNVMIAYL